MKRWWTLGFACCCALVAVRTSAQTDSADASAAHPATAGVVEAESPLSVDYLKLIWADTKETATEPLRWDAEDWRNFGLIGGGLIVMGAFIDKPIRDSAQRHRTSGSERFFTQVQRLGTAEYGLPLLAGFYGYGVFANDYESKTVALDGVSAYVISELATSTIKSVVGRARPNSGHGPGHFAPLQSDDSFPSGHAAGAFAFASVIASHYDSPWVDATAYGAAGLVGIARIRLDKHWTSDVIGGALIGGLVGHHLVEFNRDVRQSNSSLAPTIGSDGNDISFSWAF